MSFLIVAYLSRVIPFRRRSSSKMLANVFLTVHYFPVPASSVSNECNFLIKSPIIRGRNVNPCPTFVFLITAAIAGKSISSSLGRFSNCSVYTLREEIFVGRHFRGRYFYTVCLPRLEDGRCDGDRVGLWDWEPAGASASK